MIEKHEILSLAENLKLLGSTVEKDYILSWVLFGISQHPKLSEWFFKGGTCLKKCYFETYRFSEDLDFTVPKSAIYNQVDIMQALNDVADMVYDTAGIDLRTREIEVKEGFNKNGNKTFTAKYTYLGPLKLPSRNQQRIKFDITDDEIIVDTYDMREVFHRYSDAPSSSLKVKCYSINEILAEKTRALYERNASARDVYDIVNISRNFRQHVDANITRKGLEKKFEFKSLPKPSVDLILSTLNFSQLEANWEDLLKHQLEVLPSAQSFYDDLRPALAWWIDGSSDEHILAKIPKINKEDKETTLPRAQFPEPAIMPQKKLGIGRQRDFPFSRYSEQIRFAARNRLCIEIEYDGIKRLVEPYSLRQPKTGNLLLYVYELVRGESISNQIKSYSIERIKYVLVKEQGFVPRYLVEL